MSFDAWSAKLADDLNAKAQPPREWSTDACPFCPCKVIEIKQEPCYCAATHAPCSNCEGSWLECTACGARSDA